MKKTISIVLVLLTALCLFASGAQEKKTETYTVGICQFVQHVALDAATQGFKDALKAELGDAVVFDDQNASGEINNCSTIINGFVSKNVNLIMANATPPLQAAASATATIPVLGTSVTHYGTALDLDNYTGVVGTNVSGTSDLAPLDQQAAMILEWFPNAKVVGLLYCSAEPNSIFQIEEVEKHLAAMGVQTKRFSFTDTNDIASVTQKACDQSDVIYIPTDNTAASNTEAIANIVLVSKTPVIAGEEGICSGCGVATLSISYYDLGVTTGKMAAKVLKGEADISKMAIEYAPAVKKYNPQMCSALGITPVGGYDPIN
ncbi:MAG: ABC transporter substrate-binding protein [Sphaerochaetaceae bacterium]|nr:ABC transporter substrate-binding protein [Sphaerochaetaceae bacterium]